EPEEFGVEEKDSGGDDPGDHGRQARICEFSHPGAAVGELDQGNHREGQLKTENHLTENEQRGHFVLAGKTNDQGRRNDGDGAGLDDAGVKMEIVRHDRGAKDAYGDVAHFAVGEDFGTADEADGGLVPERMSKKNLVSETSGDRGDERDDEGFDKAKAAPL